MLQRETALHAASSQLGLHLNSQHTLSSSHLDPHIPRANLHLQVLSSLALLLAGWVRTSCLLVPQHLAQYLAHSELLVHVEYGVDGCVGRVLSGKMCAHHDSGWQIHSTSFFSGERKKKKNQNTMA